MRRILSTANYPFFWGPAEHSLQAYYRRLNHLAFIVAPLMFLINELLVRPDLILYKKASNALWSIIALAFNAQLTLDQNMTVFVVFVIYAACLWASVLLLPKWSMRPSEIGMKSGLPPRDTNYENVYFWISNSIEKYAYIFWNSVLIPFSFFFGSFLIGMFINLIRIL